MAHAGTSQPLEQSMVNSIVAADRAAQSGKINFVQIHNTMIQIDLYFKPMICLLNKATCNSLPSLTNECLTSSKARTAVCPRIGYLT